MGRRLGQHFLHDVSILDRIVQALDPQPSDTVIEIGPGKGSLTARLAARVGRVIAIEKDRRLAQGLRDEGRETRDEGREGRGKREQGRVRPGTRGERRETRDEREEGYAPGASWRAKLRVIEADALEVDWHEVLSLGHSSSLVSRPSSPPFKVAGNIPYYITTPLIEKALQPPRPAVAVFLVQREVADRIVAAPGSKTYGALTVGIQSVCRAEKLFTVRAGAFRPPPEVDSAVVRLTPLPVPLIPEAERLGFRTFVTRLFSQRRKQIGGSIRDLFGMDPGQAQAAISQAGISHSVRVEVVEPERLVRLFHAILTR